MKFSFSFFIFYFRAKKKGYIFIKNRINTGKVDTRIFATGRENMVAKRVTHIFLHQLLLHILWKERKEGRRKGGEKSVGSLCSENQRGHRNKLYRLFALLENFT